MPTNTLEMLRITFESDGFTFHDYGFVESIVEHRRKIYQQINGTLEGIEKLSSPDDKKRTGEYFFFFEAGMKHGVSYYLKKDDMSNIGNRAHEETHALHDAGRLDILEGRLRNFGVFIGVSGFKPFSDCTAFEQELAANIGKIYALFINGINPLSGNFLDDPYNHPAKIVFEDALNNIHPW
ncbi:hypothetical protein HYU13_02470 [Candidatus Woesearchaeota archaeon]|nr:hypothetical protein [Candidatus Woesearchaeota archaeon]